MSLPSSISSPGATYTQTEIITAASSLTTITPSTNTMATTTTATSTAAATTKASSSILAPGTIAGAAIGGVFVGAIVFFLIGCLISWLRRRKLARQRQLRDFRNSQQGAFPPPPPPAGRSFEEEDHKNLDVDPRFPQVQSVYPKMQASGAGARLNPAEVGVARSSEPRYNLSPASVRSTMSTAKLLPLRPPEQLRLKLNTRDRHLSSAHQRGSSWTVFEEDSRSTGARDSQVAVPVGYQPGNRKSSLRPRGAEPGPLPRLLYMPPSVSTTSPTTTSRNGRRPNSDITPLSPTYDPHTSPTRRSSISYLPAYYTRRSYFPASPAFTEQTLLSPPLPPSKTLTNLLLPPPPAAHPTTSSPPPPPPPPKPTRTRSATSEETSFESLYSEQTTPPAEDLATRETHPPLSVHGTMDHLSELSEIRYPKVPRSTNQAVPRHTPNASSSTATTYPPPPSNPPLSLLEKRRGAETARDVEKGLRWNGAVHAPPPTKTTGAAVFVISGKGAGDVKRISRKPLAEGSGNVVVLGGHGGVVVGSKGGIKEGGREMVMTSPVWQPKLTPTGEMVIEIS